MDKRVGIEPAPDDAEMQKWLEQKIASATDEAQTLTEEFLDVIELGRQQGDPEIFAYARLLNHLAQLDGPTLLRILSAYMWHGYKQQENK